MSSQEVDDLVAQRRRKLQLLREMSVDPYPYRFDPTHKVAEARESFDRLTTEERSIALAGRLAAVRLHGKAGFGDLQDVTGKIQLYFRHDVLGSEVFEVFKLLDIGDIIGVSGVLFTTRTGEQTLRVEELTILSKSLRPLPEKWHGLRDKEIRSRQRYLDLMVNEETRVLFRVRNRVVRAMRDCLDARGFLEVETPVLQMTYGGASANPFVTKHEALDMSLYLRIADELFLKRLLVGGLERVYEIGKDFRNEGIDRTHNPEFTQLELYQAYADYEDMMSLFQDIMGEVSNAALGTTAIEFGGNKINLSAPWQRVSVVEAIEDRTGLNVLEADQEALRGACVERGWIPEEGASRAKLVDIILSKLVEPELIQPSFLVDYPAETTPLAKRKRGDERLVERFEPFVAGMELGNAFSELNDPDDQRRRMLEQAEQQLVAGEPSSFDEDFLIALSYGMPPAGGMGIGIDRVVMLMTDTPHIRDVILFPHMRPDPRTQEEES